ncbi:MAG: hypothetical protein WDM76_09930 [Limisphaerales bacterium]
MKIKSFFISTAACLAVMVCLAEDITTADGKIYSGVTDIKVKPDGLIFNLNPTNGIGVIKVPFSKLSEDVKRKYNYDPFEEGLVLARNNKVVDLKKNLAFSLADLDVAKKRAETERKPIGFVLVWDEFFQPAVPMASGSVGGLAHFYTVFRNGVVLVFVRHEDELDKVPEAVKKGFAGPDEGGFAPNMAVVSEDCSQFICEIPLGGKDSNGQIREQIFREKIAEIKKFHRGKY